MSQTPPFQIKIVPVTPFQQNCSLIRARNGSIAVIDPGGEVDRLIAEAEAWDGKIEKIWLTHGYLDHAGGAMELKEKTGAIIEGAQEEEVFWLSQISEQIKRFGTHMEAKNVTPDRWLDDGDQVQFGNITLDVLHCPGHTPGHIVFFEPKSHIAQVGDVLFRGSVGRSDLPGGDHDTLIRSIKTKLWPLGEEVVFVPGHGPLSTFGEERRTNPFVHD